MARRFCLIYFAALASTLLVLTLEPDPLAAAQAGSTPLPQKTGAINDYAALLGSEGRKGLEELVESLQTGAGIRVTLLFSRLDPYSNPALFADALWVAWQLEAEKSLFLLFVVEETSWKFHWKASPDLTAPFSEQPVKDALKRLESSVGERKISDAAITFLGALKKQWVPEPVPLPIAEPAPPNASTNTTTTTPQEIRPRNNSTMPAGRWLGLPMSFWYVAGGVLVALFLFVLIRAALLSSCPKCGSSMQKRQEAMRYSQSQRRGSQRKRQMSYYCPNCRYQRSG